MTWTDETSWIASSVIRVTTYFWKNDTSDTSCNTKTSDLHYFQVDTIWQKSLRIYMQFLFSIFQWSLTRVGELQYDMTIPSGRKKKWEYKVDTLFFLHDDHVYRHYIRLSHVSHILTESRRNPSQSGHTGSRNVRLISSNISVTHRSLSLIFSSDIDFGQISDNTSQI